MVFIPYLLILTLYLHLKKNETTECLVTSTINKVLEASLFHILSHFFFHLLLADICLFVYFLKIKRETHVCAPSTPLELHSLRSWNLKCLSCFFYSFQATNKLKILFFVNNHCIPSYFLIAFCVLYGWLTTLTIWIVCTYKF